MAPRLSPATFATAALLLSLLAAAAEGRWDPLRMATDRFVSSPASARAGEDDASAGTKWAVLIAGSRGYYNYRHQADVCHAYQIMKRGGLRDENIIVFMYDDIAHNYQNPRKGVIINHPNGGDVYHGVPKDYTGRDVTVDNFFAVLLGNRTALTGGSGKVLASGPDDHVFIYYSDHGGPGILGMPTSPYLYGNDLVDVLKKKHASGSYKSMVFYLEACESGSIFEGLLPEDINIYATTAANAEESSWATYCPGDTPDFPKEYTTCLGDLYSIAWMEDSDTYNLRTESLKQQYGRVKDRTSVDGSYYAGSHVMQYGDVDLNVQHLVLYMGSNPENENHTFSEDNSFPSFSRAANQRDADLLHFWNKLMKSPESSPARIAAQKELLDVVAHRLHVDNSVELIGNVLFGSERATEILKAVRPSGQPLVDDWDCLKTMVRTFEVHCGSLSQYGMKHMRSLANICNAGVKKDTMAEAASQACLTYPSNPWSSISNGFSA